MDELNGLAKRAVECDQMGRIDDAISYYKKCAHRMMGLIESGKLSETYKKDVEKYLARARLLLDRNGSQNDSPSAGPISRAQKMIDTALGQDEAGNESEAMRLYTEAAEFCIAKSKLTTNGGDGTLSAKLRMMALLALDRAEELKRIAQFVGGQGPFAPTLTDEDNECGNITTNDKWPINDDDIVFPRVPTDALSLPTLHASSEVGIAGPYSTTGGSASPNLPTEATSDKMVYFKPVEFVRFVAQGMHALVLDYRDNQSETIEYKCPRGTVKLVHINNCDIVPGTLLHSLFKALDISVRPLLENISHFDLVALLGDINDITKEKGTKTFILVEALTTYNLRNKLKRPPTIIEGGFMNWKNAYPQYVNETSADITRFERTFDEQFAIWIIESKKANELRIQYPSLSKLFKDSALPKKPVQIPTIDRSKKPLSAKIRRSTSPFPQVLGGKALDDQNQRPQHPPQEENFGNHVGPPHPRRRQSITRNEQIQPPLQQLPDPQQLQVPQQQPLLIKEEGSYFKSAYEMCKQKLTSNSSYQKTPLGQTGLYNLSNTCFMNAILQPLFHTSGFAELFLNKSACSYVNENSRFGTKGIVSGTFSAFADLMWSGKFSAIRPYYFLDLFSRRVNAELANGQQHDAQEFQLYLLDALHEDTNKVDSGRPFDQNYDNTKLRDSASDYFTKSRLFASSPVNDIFNITTVTTIKCCTCKTNSVRFETHNQLSLELPDSESNSLELEECLEEHFSESEELDDPWDCPKCKSKQPAERNSRIWKVPKVLIIHLKRFSMEDKYFVKNEVEVKFDVNELDVSSFVHTNSPLEKATYSLYAVTNHSGRLNSGHYTAKLINLISTERNWLHFDDDNCASCSAPDPVSKYAFLLYYKLTNVDENFT